MYISPEHQALQTKFQQLLLKCTQYEAVDRRKDEQIQELKSQISPLKNMIEQLQVLIEKSQQQLDELLSTIEKNDKQIQGLALLEHQYEQLKRLLSIRSSEKSWVTPGQLLLELNAGTIEACKINDGQ